MAIRMERLYKQARQPYQMQLIAGAGGLGNLINWVHMIEDEQVADFLRGNELVFTTGIGHRSDQWLSGFAQGLIRNHASGLVVNIGPYIGAVPEAVKEYCEQNDFPLFTIPWHIRLVDITRDFCRRIINSEQVELSVSSALKNAIFFPEAIPKNQAQLERRGFNVSWPYCAAVIAVHSEQEDRHKEDLADVRFYAETVINRISETYSMFLHDDNLIIVFAKFADSEIASGIQAIVETCFSTRHSYRITAGIGQNQPGLALLAKSYKQAASVLRMAVKKKLPQIYYRDLGIYKLLLSTEDNQLLREIYDDILGKLADHDATHHTDYMQTLKYYLENDASVQAVAKLTYVHRNTINYKLNKIKEITGHDISRVEDRLRMMLAFKIKDIL